jgi:GNAT superfamily N-acetyltransferase
MAAQDYAIRRANIRDAERLGACMGAAYAHYADRIRDMPSVSDNCAEEIEKYLVWVAEADSEIVADIVGALILIPSDGFMLLANVAVRPGQQGSGLGKRLMNLAESEATGRGFAEMRLNTHVDMPENINLYTRNGWSEIGRTETKVSMKKNCGAEAAGNSLDS